MKKLVSLTLIFITCIGFVSKAQDYQVPVNYKLVTPADFDKYEPQIIETVDWLQDTPWATEVQKQREATAFLFKWIQGTPTITMELMPMLMNITSRNNKLMAIFIGAYTKYAIQHPGYLKDDANTAAVKALLAKYKAEPAHSKDLEIERLIKLDKDGELEDWVRNEYEKS